MKNNLDFDSKERGPDNKNRFLFAHEFRVAQCKNPGIDFVLLGYLAKVGNAGCLGKRDLCGR